MTFRTESLFSGRNLAALLAGLLLVRLLAGAWLAGHRPEFILHDDGADYRELAQAVAAGDGLTIRSVRWFEPPALPHPRPEAFRPPLLSVLAAPFLWGAPDSLFRLLAFQSLLLTALTVTVAWWLWKQAGRAATWIGVVLLNLHPLVNLSSVRFSTEILFMLCLMLLLLAWQLQDRWWTHAAAGAAVGLATLARPTALLLLPPALLLAGWRKWHCGLRKVLAATLLVLAGFAVTAGPYAARNRLSCGAISVTGFFGGYNFWVGNHPENLAAYRSPDGVAFLRHLDAIWNETQIRAAEMAVGDDDASPVRQEQFWRRAAAENLRQLGGCRWSELLAWKAWHFVRPWPQPGVHSAPAFAALAIFETALFLLGLAGLASLARNHQWRTLAELAAVIACGLAAHTLVHVYLRHRFPFLDLTLILAGACWLGGRFTVRPVV
jgi:hypothetical protein